MAPNITRNGEEETMIIEINNKEYELKYPVNTLCMMAEDGIDVMNMANFVVNIMTIRDLFYYGLKHENKKITKNQAGDLMDDYLAEDHKMAELIEVVMNALAKSLGGDKKAEDKAEDDEGAEGK
jgi:hypothetical protein